MNFEDIKMILDDDEQIVESFKPNKIRYTLINSIIWVIVFLVFSVPFFVTGLLGVIGVMKFLNDTDGTRDFAAPIVFIIVAAIILAIVITSIIGMFFRYKNSLYVITNKRFIIRSGFIGVDYKSLTFDVIGYADVRVDFLDKLIHPNTGTILFGSAATPIINGQKGGTSTFSFSYVENPYEVYKKVQACIKKTDK